MNFRYCHNCKDFTVKTNSTICTACGTRSKTDISRKPYRGVKIITVKEEICGTNIREKADGSFVDRKPDYNIWLSYGDGKHEPKFFDRKELEKYIDDLYNSMLTIKGMTDKEFAEELNKPQEPIKVPHY